MMMQFSPKQTLKYIVYMCMYHDSKTMTSNIHGNHSNSRYR